MPNEIDTARSKLLGEAVGELLAISLTPDELLSDPVYAKKLKARCAAYYERWDAIYRLHKEQSHGEV